MIVKTLIITFILVSLSVLLLGVKIFFVPKGKFPNIHIGGSKPLKEKGVHCATTQDRNAQAQSKKLDINKLINEIEK